MEEKNKTEEVKEKSMEKKSEVKVENKAAEKKQELKESPKQEAKPVKEQKPKVKKEEAIAQAIGLPLSKKHCMYISKFIKNKTVDSAIAELEQVLKFKRAVPFKGEIPHRHGNIMSGRYPINASKSFITILKGLKGNIIVNGLNLENTRIYYASASWASRPGKRGGARFKRTNIVLKAKEITENKK